MNRQQRRAKQREEHCKPWHGMTKEQREAQAFKNGITFRDIDKAYEKGFRDARDKMADSLLREIFAAAALTMKREFHFGKTRICRVLQSMDDIITTQIVDSDEAAQQVFDECGIKMSFVTLDETMSRFSEV